MNKLTVLVIDDNSAHAEGLTELLEQNGFAAMYALTGASGLQITAAHSIDAVLLDVHLPDMTGFDICQKLRSNPATRNIAVIFHTGSQRLDGRDHGGDAFLTYPVEFTELFAVIQGCVSRRKGKQPVAHSEAFSAEKCRA